MISSLKSIILTSWRMQFFLRKSMTIGGCTSIILTSTRFVLKIAFLYLELIINSWTRSRHQLLSFVDVFFGYIPIKRKRRIKPKLLFLHAKEPIATKSCHIGVTYQMLVNKVFKSQIGCNMEVYIDKMLVKSSRSDNHIADLQEAFNILNSEV